MGIDGGICVVGWKMGGGWRWLRGGWVWVSGRSLVDGDGGGEEWGWVDGGEWPGWVGMRMVGVRVVMCVGRWVDGELG